MNRGGRIETIQYLRGIAALAVAVAHIASHQSFVSRNAPLVLPEFTGFWGVDIFFVISGFIIVHITRDVAPGYMPAKQFFAKRLIRIVPAYWFFTLAMYVIGNTDWQIGDQAPGFNAAMLVKSLLFIKPGFPLLFVGWTLTMEMFFYLVFAVCLIFFQHKQRVFYVGLVFFLLTLLPAILNSDNRYFVFFTKPILLEFVAGMIIAYDYKGLQQHFTRLALPVLIVGVMLLSLSTLHFELPTLTRYRALLWGVPAILIVFGALHAQEFRNLPWVKNLGAISYSLYLCHIPCTYLSMVLVLHWLSPPINPGWIYWMLSLATSLGVATASYLFFEKLCDSQLKRLLLAGNHQEKQ